MISGIIWQDKHIKSNQIIKISWFKKQYWPWFDWFLLDLGLRESTFPSLSLFFHLTLGSGGGGGGAAAAPSCTSPGKSPRLWRCSLSSYWSTRSSRLISGSSESLMVTSEQKHRQTGRLRKRWTDKTNRRTLSLSHTHTRVRAWNRLTGTLTLTYSKDKTEWFLKVPLCCCFLWKYRWNKEFMADQKNLKENNNKQ